MNTYENAHTSAEPVAETLRSYAQNILVVVFGLLPIFFIPVATAPFEYTKIFFVLTGVLAALVLYSLAALREGSVSLGVSYPLIALWSLVGIAGISTVLSGDLKDSFSGDLLSIHSTAFLGIVALITSVWLLIDAKKATVMRLYVLLSGSTIALVLYHVIRLVFGADTLTFSVFLNSVATPVGGWNDLALFLGLSVILSLVALEQLPLTKVGRSLFAAVTAFSLIMLGVINFFTVWVVLGLTSLALVVYSLSKDRFSGAQLSFAPQKVLNSASLTVSLVVFALSVLFIIGGSFLGGIIAQRTGVSYIEVRPSLEATADIARQVYTENAFLGTGPNKFTDAWRYFKDSTINETVFWNTDFVAGNGYITTFFITTGALGGIAWIVFLLTFIGTGIRMLMNATDQDRMWYFIGVSSFVSAVYIWGMSIVYVPGPVMLMLGALCTGITLSAYRALGARDGRALTLVTNRRTGFILTLVVIGVIVGSVSLLYTTGRHYAAAYTFNESIALAQSGTASIDAVETGVLRAYGLYASDEYVRRVGEIQLARINALIGIASPTDDERAQFEKALVTGLNAAEEATQIDPTEPKNWALLGSMYNTLVVSNVEGAYDRGYAALARSRDLNPRNPLALLELAVFEGRAGKYEDARKDVESAISLKSNFTDAYFYLSQLEIMSGNVEAAIKSTLSVISLEPQNPARYYQLGLLETSQKNVDGAIAAFEQAVRYDENYANARFLLAFAYDAKGRTSDARAQLEKVLELNPGNAEVSALLETLNTQGSLNIPQTSSTTEQTIVTDGAQTTQESDGTVSTDTAPDTSLVSPVNTAPTTNGGGTGESAGAGTTN